MTPNERNKGNNQAHRTELLISIFEQNWLHARHVENERLTFTNIYFVVVAGVLAYVGSSGLDLAAPSYRALLLFLLFFSVLGLLAMSKLSAEYGNHITKIEKLLDERASEFKDYVGFPLKTGIWNTIKLRRLFIIFYCFTTALWLVLLLLSIF